MLKVRRKEGQSVVVLAALMLIPLAAIIQLSISQARQTADARTAVQAATAVASEAASAAVSSSVDDLERNIIVAACQAIDPWLPAYVASIGVSGGTLRVVAAVPTEDGADVSHAMSVNIARGAEAEMSDTPEGDSFFQQGSVLASTIPQCAGRAR